LRGGAQLSSVKVRVGDVLSLNNSLNNDAVGPLDQAHENRWTPKFRSPLI
jgi:hypothetical protein